MKNTSDGLFINEQDQFLKATPRSSVNLPAVAVFFLKVVVCALALHGMSALLAKPSDVTAPPNPAPIPTAKIVTLEPDNAPREVERFARLAPIKEWRLAMEVSGRAEKRPVENGMRLKAGQLILALEPEPFEAELNRASAVAEEWEAQRHLAEANLERTRKLVQRKAASVEELERETAARDRASSAAQAARATVATAQYSRDHSRLVAPAPGIISELTVEAGEFVQTGQQIGLFSRIDRLLVKILVPWDVRRGIEIGSKATVIDGRNQSCQGIVARAAEVESGDTGQFEIEIEVPNEENQLFAGEPVRCKFFSGQATPRLRVPRESLYEQYGQWRALIPEPVESPDADHPRFLVRSVPVTVGDSDPMQGWVEIRSGLQPGEQIVVPHRVSTIRDGQVVAPGDVKDVWLPPSSCCADHESGVKLSE